MGKIIYLISVLKTIDWLTILGFVIGVGFIFYTTFTIKDCEDSISWYNEERKEFYIQKYNDNIKIRKKIIVLVLMCVLLQALIPSKEEMYAIALTKNYMVEDMYKMTKGEIRDNIDYLFNKIEELKKWGIKDGKNIRK